MPKNKDLIVDIEDLAAKLELEGVETKDLNNEALVALKKELNSQLEAKAPAPSEAPKAEAPKAEAPKHAGPVVAPGKSLITKRGVQNEGAPIKASDLGGGDASFRSLVKAGFIVE